MFNPLELLRLRSVMEQGQQGLPSTTGPMNPQGAINLGNAPPNPPPITPNFSAAAEIPQQQPQMQEDPFAGLQYENAANSRFSGLIDQMPQRQSPGIMARLTGVAQGIAHGPRAQEEAMFAPYLRELSDWKERIGPAQNAAALERQMNTSLAGIHSADRRASVAEQRADTYAQRVSDQSRTDSERTDIARRAQDLKEAISKRPDLKWELDENNEYIGLDKNGAPAVKSGIKSNQLSDAQKIAMGLDAAKQRIQAAGDQDAALEGLRQEGRISLEEKKAELGTEKAELPTQTRVRFFNKAAAALNTHPEWKRYITLGEPGTSDFKLNLPSGWLQSTKDANRKTYEEISNSIYGPPVVQRNKKTGQIRESRDGGQTWTIRGQ